MIALSGCSATSSPGVKSNDDSLDYAKSNSNNDGQEAVDKDIDDSKPAVFQVTDKDIEEAKLTVEKYFKAITEGDLASLQETLGRYKDGYTDQFNVKEAFKRPKRTVVKSISYPGKYHIKNEVPGSYTSNFHSEPYRVMVLHVVYEIYDGKKLLEKIEWDYILIKETKNASWLIHDWGY